mmetsp:Transcript_23941/g.48888  ORF Transcript_23941/g.48888 Transcript_23941/m.48888 type:complete len:110 (+) Transcript_23941:303-632(+)
MREIIQQAKTTAYEVSGSSSKGTFTASSFFVGDRPKSGIQVDEELEAGEKRSSPNEPRPPGAESSRPEGVLALAVDLAKDRSLLSNAPATLSNPAWSLPLCADGPLMQL